MWRWSRWLWWAKVQILFSSVFYGFFVSMPCLVVVWKWWECCRARLKGTRWSWWTRLLFQSKELKRASTLPQKVGFLLFCWGKVCSFALFRSGIHDSVFGGVRKDKQGRAGSGLVSLASGLRLLVVGYRRGHAELQPEISGPVAGHCRRSRAHHRAGQGGQQKRERTRRLIVSILQVQLGAFRTYPDDYKPPESDSSYQSVPLDKVKLRREPTCFVFVLSFFFFQKGVVIGFGKIRGVDNTT